MISWEPNGLTSAQGKEIAMERGVNMLEPIRQSHTRAQQCQPGAQEIAPAAYDRDASWCAKRRVAILTYGLRQIIAVGQQRTPIERCHGLPKTESQQRCISLRRQAFTVPAGVEGLATV